jgi:hypothetical protein
VASASANIFQDENKDGTVRRTREIITQVRQTIEEIVPTIKRLQ